jgi:hypothetical protein
VARKIHGRDTPHSFLCIDHEAVLLQCSQDLGEMFLVSCMVHTAHNDVIHKGKNGVHLFYGSVDVALEGRPAFLRPNGSLLYLKRPNGFVLAVLGTSAGFTGI